SNLEQFHLLGYCTLPTHHNRLWSVQLIHVLLQHKQVIFCHRERKTRNKYLLLFLHSEKSYEKQLHLSFQMKKSNRSEERRVGKECRYMLLMYNRNNTTK